MNDGIRILVTGGAGYIGSVLVPLLLTENYHVTVIDNLLYHQASLLDCCHNKRFRFVRGDVRDETLMHRQIGQSDVVIHLACLTGAPLCEKDPWAAKQVIVDATKTILRHRTTQPILFPNTNSGYGIGSKDRFCTEDTPLQPISLYGRLKVEAERMIVEAKNAVSLRLATVFGASPRMRTDLLVNDFVYRALTDRFIVLFEADAKRNYIHVRDVCGAFVFMLANWKETRDNIFNLGLSTANLSKRELCCKIQEHLPDFYFTVSDIGEDPDKRDYMVSNEKIERSGYVPSFDLDRGIEELMKAYGILDLKKDQYVNCQH